MGGFHCTTRKEGRKASGWEKEGQRGLSRHFFHRCPPVSWLSHPLSLPGWRVLKSHRHPSIGLQVVRGMTMQVAHVLVFLSSFGLFCFDLCRLELMSPRLADALRQDPESVGNGMPTAERLLISRRSLPFLIPEGKSC